MANITVEKDEGKVGAAPQLARREGWDLKDGVLKIVLPKKPEARARQVRIKTG